MTDRRSLSSFTAGESSYDHPPAHPPTISLTSDVSTRLDRLRATLSRHREEQRLAQDRQRAARWNDPPTLRRRRLRPGHSPTFEGRPYPRSTATPEADPESERHVSKKRKYEHASSKDNKAFFKYGKYGQEQSGRLKLQLLSVDGGTHDGRGLYGPENLLKHDRSVYCSKFARCNIVLRHHDGTPFCLEKLFIVAPDTGFTAPVRDGVAYVSMDLDDIRSVNQRAIADAVVPAKSPPRETSRSAQLSLLEALNDPVVEREARDLANDQSSDSADDWLHGGPDSEETRPARDSGWWPALMPTSYHPATAAPLTVQQHYDDVMDNGGSGVAVLSDEDIGWPEEPTSAAVEADRQRRERVSQYEEEGLGTDLRFRARRPPRLDMPHAWAEQSAEEDQEKTTNGLVRVRFQMKSGKSQAAIVFDPPVSGSYILLQLANPDRRSNIDLQSVIGIGYAGPR